GRGIEVEPTVGGELYPHMVSYWSGRNRTSVRGEFAEFAQGGGKEAGMRLGGGGQVAPYRGQINQQRAGRGVLHLRDVGPDLLEEHSGSRHRFRSLQFCAALKLRAVQGATSE